MSGTKQGALQASTTNKQKYGADYYAKIGAMGGKKGRTGGFYANKELAKEAGRKGAQKRWANYKKTIKIKDVQETPDLLGFNYEVLPSEPKERSLKSKLLAKVRI